MLSRSRGWRKTLTVEYSDAAAADLKQIWNWNADHYGRSHASKYIQYLRSSIGSLRATPHHGSEIAQLPPYRKLLLLKRSGGHGHMAIYQVVGDVIRVVRILHTAQDYPEDMQR